ncbi:uncharacterized protein [Lepisosteus oculatus]|uniref:uncharacterized protein n=1 Tax=Lepisosteus oculatus TaxID=7918 RepID=UPI00073FEF1D|nr:PREDICTED: uncharacterized protein LOC107077991 [Lepisosteus oculatus]
MDLLKHLFVLLCFTGLSFNIFHVEQFPNICEDLGRTINISCYYGKDVITRAKTEWWFKTENTTEDKIVITSDTTYGNQFHTQHDQLNKRYVLTVKNVQVQNKGIYTCKITKITPPPAISGIGNGTKLCVQAPPKTMEFRALSHSLISCGTHSFYPKNIEMHFQSTCGTYQTLNESLDQNYDMTFNATKKFVISFEACHNGTEISCVVHHAQSRVTLNKSQWISAKREKGYYHSSTMLLASGITAGVGIIAVVTILIKGCLCCEHKSQNALQKDGLSWHGKMNTTETNGNEEEDFVSYSTVKISTKKTHIRKNDEVLYSTVINK